MKVCIQFSFGLIALATVILGAPHNEVNKRSISSQIPQTFTKDPWLVPKTGVLISEYSPVYLAVRGSNGKVEFHEAPNAIRDVNRQMLTREEYRKAYAGNINNPNNDFVEAQKEATALPEKGGRPNVLYPEILVAVGNDLYKLLGEDMWTTIPYVMAFWNGVDMMYRGIENPQVRMNIAGIIIETEDMLLDFLEPHPINGTTTLKWNALYKANKFWYNQKDQIPLDSYDEVVAMTTREICGSSEIAPCEGNIVGQSWMGTVCQYNDEEVKKVAIIVDNGQFAGISTAAHEFGHSDFFDSISRDDLRPILSRSLGLNHDSAAWVLEGELDDKPACNETNENFIMAPYTHRHFFKNRWSPCSMDYLDGFLKTRNATCLLNTPKIGGARIPRLLPGKLTSVNEQCKGYQYKKSCVNENEIVSPCERLSCEDDYCHVTGEVAVEGTPCDDNDPSKFCMFGECISASKFV